MNLARATIAIIALLALCSGASRQAQQRESKDGSGSIAGRLTSNGRGVPNLEVVLQPASSNGSSSATQSVTTDEEGRYRITGLMPGQYSIVPLNSAYIIHNDNRSSSPGKTISLKDGQALEGVDFALVRGGVITGKVMTAEGRPAIGKRIEIALLDERRQKLLLPSSLNDWMFEIDDRGVYRLYGLPAGRYLVSAGDNQYRFPARGSGAVFYQRTYYPGVSEEAQAAIIEVREGNEAANIDIQLSRPTKLLSASGRIVTETGQGVPNMSYGREELSGRGGASRGLSTLTNSQGEFRLDALRPGRYRAYAVPDDDQNLYSDSAIFEITDRDLTNLKIIVRRGGTIKGVVALDGNANPDLLSQLTGFTVVALQAASNSPFQNPAYIESDSSFVLTKLQPGKVRLAARVWGFTLVRVERHGAEQPEGIEVGPGETVTGVRLVFAYGENVIRGQVKIEGGALPEGAILSVSAHRLGATGPIPGSDHGGRIDEQGQFTIEGLVAGDYELRLRLFLPRIPDQPPLPPSISVTQKVAVGSSAETQVTLTLNLTAKDKEEKR